MKSVAVVFPGQGAQAEGMGKALYESKEGKAILERLEKIRKGTKRQLITAKKEELTDTANAQPCIFAVSLASVLSEAKEFSSTAGFSVGEIAALTYAKVFSLEDGFSLVIKRAQLMGECAKKTAGTMAAVLRLEKDKVLQLCKKHSVYAVNFNSPDQIVVSGEAAFMQNFVTAVTEAGGRAIPLAVSGAFHSPLMNEASEKFRQYLSTVKASAPQIPVYSNVTASPYPHDEEAIKDLLASQIKSPVLWVDTIKNMAKDNIVEFIEAQPGKVLTGLISKIMLSV